MKEYELTVLVHPDLEANLEGALGKVRELIGAQGGEITKEEVWGKRRLAYQIRHQDFAVYAYFEAKLPAAAPAKIDSTLNITDEVLRHLLVTVDEKARKAMAAEAARAAENNDTRA